MLAVACRVVRTTAERTFLPFAARANFRPNREDVEQKGREPLIRWGRKLPGRKVDADTQPGSWVPLGRHKGVVGGSVGEVVWNFSCTSELLPDPWTDFRLS